MSVRAPQPSENVIIDRDPACFHCRHYAATRADPTPRCPAYPRRIPDDIMAAEDMHTRLRGDEAAPVLFAPIP